MSYLNDIDEYFRSLLVTLTYTTANISWPNRTYTGDEDKYLQYFFSPSTIRQAGMGVYGLDERQGLIQVNIVEPLGSGIVTAGALGSDLEELFYRGRLAVYNGVSVTIDKCQVNKGINDEEKHRYVVPVTVFWHSFTQPH